MLQALKVLKTWVIDRLAPIHRSPASLRSQRSTLAGWDPKAGSRLNSYKFLSGNYDLCNCGSKILVLPHLLTLPHFCPQMTTGKGLSKFRSRKTMAKFPQSGACTPPTSAGSVLPTLHHWRRGVDRSVGLSLTMMFSSSTRAVYQLEALCSQMACLSRTMETKGAESGR